MSNRKIADGVSSSSPQTRSRGALRERVVVITGASSGIGRATARAFAREGAHVVLAARNEEALREVGMECSALGVRALVVPTDVTDAGQVETLARAAVGDFGRIDVWINNAGVGLFGPFLNAGVEQHRRVVEINLFGTMHGAAAVLPYFMRQGFGTMITNISIGGFVPVPFAAAYTASKFGLRGFMAGLRQEVASERHVRLCSLFPGVIDTPGYQHGANVSDVELKPTPFVYPPEHVARAFVSLAVRPRDELALGWSAKLARCGYGLAPLVAERAAGLFFRHYVNSGPASPRTGGNLFRPSEGPMKPSGGWARSGARGRRAVSWVCAGLAATAAGLLLAKTLRPRALQKNFPPRRRARVSNHNPMFQSS